MSYTPELATVARSLVTGGRGILAIDESNKTCNARFAALHIAETEDARRAYRELLLTTPNLGRWISGAILYDETLRQSTADDVAFVRVMNDAGILPGIKVDTGTVQLAGSLDELITEGLDGLPKRLDEYRILGARFTKWRAVIAITEHTPTPRALRANAHSLARYAKAAQTAGLVPIVEPEVLADGAHDIERCAIVTREALAHVFEALDAEEVDLGGMVLKPNMVTPGLKSTQHANVAEVAKATLEVLAANVPADVAGIAFLSGGQDDIVSTQHLQAMNALPGRRPWPLTFSYGRALQQAALRAWRGSPREASRAQALLAHRAACNAAAALGEYGQDVEDRLSLAPTA
ncbi:MAG: class I fructose-bisphosphate aldolase [Vulcanimicrobiaceae bacterium]